MDQVDGVPAKCFVKKISRDGCRVSLKDAPSPHAIVDLDCDHLSVPVGDKRCDFLFIGVEDGGLLVALLELKKGKAEASQLAAQLQGGVDFAKGLIPQGARFVAVAVCGGGLHRIQRERLKERRCHVRFRCVGYEIQLIGCGAPLSKAIRQQGAAKRRAHTGP